MNPVHFTILGSPHSKSNSSQIITMPDGRGGHRASLIKSKKARTWVQDALPQIPASARIRMQGPLVFFAKIFYPSNIQDLDESLVLDALQDVWKTTKRSDGTKERHLVQAGVYCNDRQVKEKHIYHAIDKVNPRVEIHIESMDAQRELAFGPPPTLVVSKPSKPKAEPKVEPPAPAPRPAAPKPEKNTVAGMFTTLAELKAAREARGGAL